MEFYQAPQPLVLPPAPEATLEAVFTPWVCAEQALCFDQALIMTAGAAKCLGELYELPNLQAAMAPTAGADVQEQMYPERLVWHAFKTNCAVEPTPLWGAYLTLWKDYKLIGAEGNERDPYGKLKADYPMCSYTLGVTPHEVRTDFDNFAE